MRGVRGTLLLAALLCAGTGHGATQDNNVEWAGLFHDSTELFVSPLEPRAGQSVKLTFRTLKNDCTGVRVRVWDTAGGGSERWTAMSRTSSDAWFDYWTATIATGSSALWYRFEVTDGADTDYYNAQGGAQDDWPPASSKDFQIRPGFKTPAWVKDAVFYQIFPDRFYDGDPTNNVREREYSYGVNTQTGEDAWVYTHADWSARPDNSSPAHMTYEYTTDFYGGDLQGITAKLDYLTDLGVNALYLNPVFLSPSNHKYDTQDFLEVDPHFGGNAALHALMAAAHARGIRVILDGVFNHTSDWHRWMDRKGVYPTLGAFESQASPWLDRYTFTSWPLHYCSWWGFSSLPKINYAAPGVRDWLYGAGEDGELPIASKWIVEAGVDGWRLDVPNDAGPYCEHDDHSIWKGFRQAVKSANPEAFITGEIWTDAASWLQGDEFDSVMNYNGFADPVSLWINGQNTAGEKTPADLGIASFDVDRLDSWLRGTRYDYPAPATQTMLNLLDSHDTPRFLRRTNGLLKTDPAFFDERREDVWRLYLAVIFQMTYVGAPSVYYGDEIGLSGASDPDCRRTFDWSQGNWNTKLRDLYKRMIAIRHRHSALRTGAFLTLHTHNQNGTYAFGRFDASSKVAVVLNNSASAKTLDVPVWLMGVPDGAVMTDELAGTSVAVSGGVARVAGLDGHWGAVLTLSTQATGSVATR
jgi:alpha-glucosidase